jgi:hypothetical protein
VLLDVVDAGKVKLNPTQVGDRFGIREGPLGVQDLDIGEQISRQILGPAGGMYEQAETGRDRLEAFDEGLREGQGDEDGHVGHRPDCTTTRGGGRGRHPE